MPQPKRHMVTYYKTSTGEIDHSGPVVKGLEPFEEGYDWVPGRWSAAQFYVEDGKPKRLKEMPLHITDSQVTGIPKGTVAHVRGARIGDTVEDGVLDLSAPFSEHVLVKLTCPTYLPERFKVYVEGTD